MTCLIDMLRRSQQNLAKVVNAVSDYEMKEDEKLFLIEAAQSSDSMMDDIKKTFPSFHQRIYTDTEEAFKRRREQKARTEARLDSDLGMVTEALDDAVTSARALSKSRDVKDKDDSDVIFVSSQERVDKLSSSF